MPGDNITELFIRLGLKGKDQLVADGASAADALGSHLKRLAETASRSVGSIGGAFSDANAAIKAMANSALGGVQGLEQGPEAAGRAMQQLAGDTGKVARVLSADLKSDGFQVLSGIVGKAEGAAEAFGKLGASGAASMARLGEALAAVAKSAGTNFAGMGQALGALTGAIAEAGKATPGGSILSKLASPITVPLKGVLDVASVVIKPITVPLKLAAEGAQAMLGNLADGLKKVGEAATVPFVIASAAIGGWVRAGLAGTTMGERLGLQFNLLSREIASLFIPVLNRVIEVLQSVTSWFRTLSGPQQAFIGWTLAATVGLLGVATILPRIVSGLSAIGGVLSTLAANPIVAIVAAIAALLVGTEQGRSALGRLAQAFAPILSAVAKLFEALKPVFDFIGKVIGAVADAIAFAVDKIGGAVEAVTDFLGLTSEEDRQAAATQDRAEGRNRHELQNTGRGRESFEASFNRFQTAALRTGQGDVAERQLTVLNAILVAVGGVEGAVNAPAPAPVS